MGKIRRAKRTRTHRADPILGRAAGAEGDLNEDFHAQAMGMSSAIFEELGASSVERQAKAADAVNLIPLICIYLTLTYDRHR
jgi:hypothetical protein